MRVMNSSAMLYMPIVHQDAMRFELDDLINIAGGSTKSINHGEWISPSGVRCSEGVVVHTFYYDGDSRDFHAALANAIVELLDLGEQGVLVEFTSAYQSAVIYDGEDRGLLEAIAANGCHQEVMRGMTWGTMFNEFCHD